MSLLGRTSITWDEYFMALAQISAKRSKDPCTQVGCCIVNSENKVVGLGYNGFPKGISDLDLPWTKEGGDMLKTKYPYVCHAEMNAIMNKNECSIKGCTLYTTQYPCNECAKLIIQSGITKVVYLEQKEVDTVSVKASNYLFKLAKVEVELYRSDGKTIKLIID